jgi:photosystem II stability/assembly factor-like uncharacterized protein
VRIVAATGDAVARIDLDSGEVGVALEGSGAACIAVDPRDPERMFAGTPDRGLFASADGGRTWRDVSAGLPHRRVTAVSISPSHVEGGRSVVYAGTEPSSLYRSEDDGATWRDLHTLLAIPSAPTWSFPPRPWTSHVRWIAPHHADPDLIFAGIELGGVMRSRDRGATWEDRKPGSYPDSHALATHPDAGEYVYEAAGGGVALSEDGGDSWRAVDEGLDRRYVWALAVDPEDPGRWFVSAARGPREAHGGGGRAGAGIYRKTDGSPWELLDEDHGLESSLGAMPYALLAPAAASGLVVAGFDDGRLFTSHDRGETWSQLDARVERVVALAG